MDEEGRRKGDGGPVGKKDAAGQLLDRGRARNTGNESPEKREG